MLVAALLNALASVLQRRTTRDQPESAEFSIGMIRDLLRHPVWLLGICSMIAGFVLHAVSISLSRIALVQPLLVAELPFTLVMASWAFRMRLAARDWLAIGMQSAGLVAFVACLAPSDGDPGAVPGATWALGIGVTAAAIAAIVVLGHRGRREHRAALLGIATGAAFGLNSALIAGVGATVTHGGGLFTTWQTYGVAVLGPISFFLLQNALSAGNLVASQPGFTLVNPLVSVAWGLVVFGEHARGWPFLAGTLAGAGLIGAGTILLARSELLDPDVTHEHDGEADERAAGQRAHS
ncbi:DMT family transporter [Pseudonocardia asaccharolytica]|uniref:Uncharacterized protein n=1 Tax=Pseudonocardia asaccharolytica DSM 44247 = NBRC 16224 TaxID=1123024 RepID=A0A511D6W2_9PSEU|nr:DMT family transporter [Pseudonocardia asaccharolytica]GEL20535.1 hypothetical protein PA7_43720 [Pseudonocardia asaccharolytica DSM 44247 = NBRC 16224]